MLGAGTASSTWDTLELPLRVTSFTLPCSSPDPVLAGQWAGVNPQQMDVDTLPNTQQGSSPFPGAFQVRSAWPLPLLSHPQ